MVIVIHESYNSLLLGTGKHKGLESLSRNREWWRRCDVERQVVPDGDTRNRKRPLADCREANGRNVQTMWGRSPQPSSGCHVGNTGETWLFLFLILLFRPDHNTKEFSVWTRTKAPNSVGGRSAAMGLVASLRGIGQWRAWLTRENYPGTAARQIRSWKARLENIRSPTGAGETDGRVGRWIIRCDLSCTVYFRFHCDCKFWRKRKTN